MHYRNRSTLFPKSENLIGGRPSAVGNHVSPGERNPIEGKFGQAKTAYGLNRIKARLRNTSESWIACIFLVLNLVKLAGAALPYTLLKWWDSFSARDALVMKFQTVEELLSEAFLPIEILSPPWEWAKIKN